MASIKWITTRSLVYPYVASQKSVLWCAPKNIGIWTGKWWIDGQGSKRYYLKCDNIKDPGIPLDRVLEAYSENFDLNRPIPWSHALMFPITVEVKLLTKCNIGAVWRNICINYMRITFRLLIFFSAIPVLFDFTKISLVIGMCMLIAEICKEN